MYNYIFIIINKYYNNFYFYLIFWCVYYKLTIWLINLFGNFKFKKLFFYVLKHCIINIICVVLCIILWCMGDINKNKFLNTINKHTIIIILLFNYVLLTNLNYMLFI